MDSEATAPRIPESFLEHRQVFAGPWLDRWVIPNPFLSALVPQLRQVGVELSDVSFNKEAANVGDASLTILIRSLSAGVRIGLDAVTFTAANPYWDLAPRLVPVFERISESVRLVAGGPAKSQEAVLALHVTPGAMNFGKTSTSLVDPRVAGDSLFCGISLHWADHAMVVDKSLKYEGGAFVRLQRKFAGDISFADVASQLYLDEKQALGLLDLQEVP